MTSQRQRVVGGWHTQHHPCHGLQEAECLSQASQQGHSPPPSCNVTAATGLPPPQSQCSAHHVWECFHSHLVPGSSHHPCEVGRPASHFIGEGPEVQNGEVTCLRRTGSPGWAWSSGKISGPVFLQPPLITTPLLWMRFHLFFYFFSIFPSSFIPTLKVLHPLGSHTATSKVHLDFCLISNKFLPVDFATINRLIRCRPNSFKYFPVFPESLAIYSSVIQL